MTTIGIIAEYNPFHNGHIYHIKKIKELFPDSIIILVLNGYFLERGELSILTKEDKTKIALNNNIDLVFELPFVFGTQSADIFAYKSIEILNHLKVDYLIFGSETNDIKKLSKVANYQLNSKDYNSKVKELLSSGINYPTALNKALKNELISTPNDLLGLSYIKAIMLLKSNIKPITIKRTNNYHDLDFESEIVSASNIRNKISNKENINKYIPKETINCINELKDYFSFLKYKILTSKDLSIYLDVDEGIENRILKYINKSNSIEELILNIKTKRYTYNKINRMLMHILIGLTKKDNSSIKDLDYLRLLGFNDVGKKYLNSIKKDIKVPIITKINNMDSITSKYEIISSNIYALISKKEILTFENNGKPIKK